MAYVGTPIDTQNQFQSLQGKRFNGDGSTTAFTLDIAPSSVLDIEVFVENVRQDPNSAYTLNGTTLTFTGAPPSGTNNIYVVHQAKAVGTIDVPATYKSEAQTISGARTHTGVVGIGAANSTSVPLRIFDTGSNTATTELLRLETGSSTDDSGIKLDFRTAHTNGIIEFLDGSGSFDGNFVFKTGTGSALATPAERLRITPNGLAIGGTGTANTLDDYEEGTFTPTFSSSGGAYSISHSGQQGKYTKIGQTVVCHFLCAASGTPSGGSGDFRLTGLPFTPADTSTIPGGHGIVGIINNTNINVDAVQLMFNLGSADTFANLMFITDSSSVTSSSNAPNTIIHANGPRIDGTLVYRTAS